ncbi:hypothetical protein ACRC7T_18675 (plasmid) [Segnochrobactraceae bacterium EtOH-i3]
MNIRDEAAEVVFNIYGLRGDREEMMRAAAKLECAFADLEYHRSLLPDAKGRVKTWIWRPWDGLVRRTTFR